MQYLYNDGDVYYFMDLETYEQLPLNRSQVEDAIPYVKENTNVTVRFFKGAAFSVEAAQLRGAGGDRYRARLQGRHRFQHSPSPPPWRPATPCRFRCSSNTGDMIRIDTRTGEYMERA